MNFVCYSKPILSGNCQYLISVPVAIKNFRIISDDDTTLDQPLGRGTFILVWGGGSFLDIKEEQSHSNNGPE